MEGRKRGSVPTWDQFLPQMVMLGAALFPWLVVARAWRNTLKDTRLVMEVPDEGLITLVNSQNHKDKAVMRVARA